MVMPKIDLSWFTLVLMTVHISYEEVLEQTLEKNKTDLESFGLFFPPILVSVSFFLVGHFIFGLPFLDRAPINTS